jgi:hypothetical protein
MILKNKIKFWDIHIVFKEIQNKKKKQEKVKKINKGFKSKKKKKIKDQSETKLLED